ncbi:hypothetical protein ACHAWF_007562 [Thalassiosira exigua]
MAFLLSVAIAVDTCHALLTSPLREIRAHHVQTAASRPIKTWPSPRGSLLFSTTATAAASTLEDATSGCDHEKFVAKNSGRAKELGAAFAQKLSELEEYKRVHGHCLVPKRYERNPSLGNWVNKQRQNHRKLLRGGSEHLTLDSTGARNSNGTGQKRMSALNKIGFVWDASAIRRSTRNDAAWQKMYQDLSRFHAANGHCRVPSSSPLGQWTVRQRFLYRQDCSDGSNTSLTPERIELLNALDFPWTTRSERLWEERMYELREFKKIHGHCMVSMTYAANPQLSAWVATQRKNYNRRRAGKSSPLSMRRIEELEAMGFVWSYWDHNFMSNRADA